MTLVVGLVVSSVGFCGPVSAENFVALKPNAGLGCDSPVYQADNYYHQFQYAPGLSAQGQNAADHARNNVVSPTDMDAPLNGSDVIVRDDDYTNVCGYNWWDPEDIGDTTIGLYTCEQRTTAGACDSAIIRLEETWGAQTTGDMRRSLACHEVGHSVGLQHRAENLPNGHGCMPAIINGRQNWSTHDRVHVNFAY
ncbi:hypothetical protein [Nocardioides sp.]|uniref:hypothetical protein n=1 Tax=Nocardioides sp. TaxID=35761 RepID=UPI00356730DA